MEQSSSLDHVPRTVRGHFQLHFYAAVYNLIRYMHYLGERHGHQLAATLNTFPFLAAYFTEMLPAMPEGISWDDGRRWWETSIAAWERDCPAHLPLRALTEQGDLDLAARIAFVLVGLVEEDSRFGTVFARLQEPLPYRRPCLELIGQIMADRRLVGADIWGACRAPLSAGLIEAANRDAPRAEWELRVPPAIWDAARGEIEAHLAPGCRYYPPADSPRLSELILPAPLAAQLEQVAQLAREDRLRALILRGIQGSERLQVIGAVARALDMGLIAADLGARPGEPADRRWQVLGPLCTMARAIPVVTYDLGPGETAEVPALAGYRGPLAALLGLEGGLIGPAFEQAISLTLPLPRAVERRRLWQNALGGQAVENLEAISQRFHIPGDYIRQAGRTAAGYAALSRREMVTADDIRTACRALNRQQLDSYAARLDSGGSWGQLVVSAATMDKLRDLERRCWHRERLLDHLGPAFGSSANRGVRALFSGASGTGKTLAAKILAAELGMDLYRVDLGAVINKYIGETEKNLHQVLSRAEALDVILLLDEGDALLGNRTEVKSSNDRYANLETNYLLQRLEHYQGIIVVTTNAGQYIDSAFQRRMDVLVNFVAPQADERWTIWQLHLPGNHAIEPADLQNVAVRCALSGGQIRNAALYATLLALDSGDGVVRRWHLEQAIQSEYRKAGATCPLQGLDEPNEPSAGVATFLEMLAQ